MKSIVMQKCFIVLSSNMTYVAGVYYLLVTHYLLPITLYLHVETNIMPLFIIGKCRSTCSYQQTLFI